MANKTYADYLKEQNVLSQEDWEKRETKELPFIKLYPNTGTTYGLYGLDKKRGYFLIDQMMYIVKKQHQSGNNLDIALPELTRLCTSVEEVVYVHVIAMSFWCRLKDSSPSGHMVNVSSLYEIPGVLSTILKEALRKKQEASGGCPGTSSFFNTKSSHS